MIILLKVQFLFTSYPIDLIINSVINIVLKLISTCHN